jgi:predicted enzyme related to lactoylglutathione lyase
MIERLGIVSIPVADQDRAKSFYVEQLGFQCLADVPFAEGMRWITVAPPGAETILSLVTWSENMKPGSLEGLIFVVDDIEREYAALVARGVAFDRAPHVEPFGKFAQFRDPDGNRLTLRELLN